MFSAHFFHFILEMAQRMMGAQKAKIYVAVRARPPMPQTASGTEPKRFWDINGNTIGGHTFSKIYFFSCAIF